MNVVSAIDEFTKENGEKQLGENQHIEYSWSSHDRQEQIVQLFFQLVRTNSNQHKVIQHKFCDILKSIVLSKDDTDDTRKLHESVVVRMIYQTRDIVSGKGEYALAYMMLLTLYDFFPQLALRTLETFVHLDGNQPYGSWKDMKYIAYHCKMVKMDENHEIIQKCVDLINAQLRKDDDCTDDASFSLCAKWVPREGSKKHSWFFRRLATDFFKDDAFTKTAKTVKSMLMSKKKCYMKYRRIVANLNRRLDTVQIKQCGNTWRTIDHNKTTSITLSRNKKAFLNVKKNGEERSPLPDRIQCAENFKAYIDRQIKSGKELKGKNVGLNDFTHQAMEILKDDKTLTVEADLLNSQWRSNASVNGALGKIIAMVDVSGSMKGDPMNAAIALGIRVAEKSMLGKRVLTFASVPSWHNLDGKEDFISMVDHLQGAKWGAGTNFYEALKVILDALMEKQVPPEEAEGMILAVFSDMQIDQADQSSNSMMETVQDMYQSLGYTCPHILFWNLRSTSGFPCLSNKKGASMISGFSPSLLNLFCEKGMAALENITPWSTMLELLDNERYNIIV